MAKLRPINETRRPDGTLTSETARRLLCRRGGLKRAEQQRATGFQMLHDIRPKSILMRSLKAGINRPCQSCSTFAESMLEAWSKLTDQSAPSIHPDDAAKL